MRVLRAWPLPGDLPQAPGSGPMLAFVTSTQTIWEYDGTSLWTELGPPGGTVYTAGAGLQLIGFAFSVIFGSTSGTVCQGDDSRLSNARTPTTHASSHNTGGSDPITTLAQSVITGLTAALAALIPKTWTLTAGTGLTGGGDGSASRTIALANVGTAGTYASPSSVTTNAQGQVTSITPGTGAAGPVVLASGYVAGGVFTTLYDSGGGWTLSNPQTGQFRLTPTTPPANWAKVFGWAISQQVNFGLPGAAAVRPAPGGNAWVQVSLASYAAGTVASLAPSNDDFSFAILQNP